MAREAARKLTMRVTIEQTSTSLRITRESKIGTDVKLLKFGEPFVCDSRRGRAMTVRWFAPNDARL